jgi:hypothetical protein
MASENEDGFQNGAVGYSDTNLIADEVLSYIMWRLDIIFFRSTLEISMARDDVLCIPGSIWIWDAFGLQ